MSSGIIFDHFGQTLNDGDLVMWEGTVFRVVTVFTPEQPSILDPTVKNPQYRPSLTAIRLVADVTLMGETAKKFKNLYRLSFIPPNKTDAEKPPS